MIPIIKLDMKKFVKKSLQIPLTHLILVFCFMSLLITPSYSEEVYLTIGKGFGSPGSRNNQIIVMLENPLNQVKGVQLEICDEGNYLSSKRCSAIGRASEFFCNTNDLRNGCTRTILYSVGDLIEEGEGSILIVDYDVSENAPSGQCISLSLNKKNSQISDENNKSLKVTTEPGEFCFEGGSGDETSTTTTSKTPITTTTILSTKTTTIKTTPDIQVTTTPRTLTTPEIHTTTTPITIREPTTKTEELPESITEMFSETTTIPLSSSYQIFISPSSITLNSGGMVEFRANSIVDGKKVKGIYKWELISASPIGSTINENGLFTAGNNNSDYTIKGIARVTDALHENSEATVTITINIKKPSPIGCELSISPSSVTLFPGDTLTFSARNFGERCAEGSYKWKILSKMDSHISRKGLYTAGNNESGDSAFDILIVEDTINDIKADAMITVLSKEKSVQTTQGSTQKTQQKTISRNILIIVVSLIILLLTGAALIWWSKR